MGRLTPVTAMRYVGDNHTLYKSQLERTLKRYRTVPLGEAFAYSVNPVFGRIGLYIAGAKGLRRYAYRFGFEESVPFELSTDTARLGACDSPFAVAEVASGFNQDTRISPLFGALLASAVCEKGRMPRPSLVDSVTDGKTQARLYGAKQRVWKEPLQPGTAEMLVKMMKNVVRYGTARESFEYVKQSHRFRSMDYGGKTGSVDRDGVGRVDWFVGFARDRRDTRKRLAVAVVTVHGPLWTVHSSFLASELLRAHVRALDAGDEARRSARGGPAGHGTGERAGG
jgi:cell division protein FtsI/penicillin-binding protein 2